MNTTKRTVTGAGGVKLAVTEWGSASEGQPTVVLVHGYPDTSSVWTPVAELLADCYHVVTYDVRGAGASTTPQRTADYRVELLVADLAAVVDATSGGRPVHLVGHDWGSIQSWQAVCDDEVASRFASFTSIYAPGLDHMAPWVRTRLRHPSPRHVADLLSQQVRSWYILAFHLPGAKLLWRAGLGRAWPSMLETVEKVTPTDSYPAATLGSDGANGVALYRANFVNHLVRPAPGTTAVPTQVIVPRGDHYVSPALSKEVERWVTGSLWRTEVNGGHWLPRSEADLVAGYIGELIEHVEGAPESPRLVRSRVTNAAAGAVGETSTAAAAGAASTTASPSVGSRKPFWNQVVVITGAGAGIGRATALLFARQGATVVATDLNPGAAKETALQVEDLGATAHHRQVDVTDPQAMEELAAWVEQELGGADIVVNNAGIGMAGPMLDTTVEDWDQILGVNLWGVIHGCRLFGRQMAQRRQGGHIVNVASAAAYTPSRMYPAYATTKAAVLMLTECLQGELASSGIKVHAICPQFVKTNISTSTHYVGISDEEEDVQRRAAQRFYDKRGLPAEDVAEAIVAAVRRNQAVVPVGREARAGRTLNRLLPSASRALARIDFGARLFPTERTTKEDRP